MPVVVQRRRQDDPSLLLEPPEPPVGQLNDGDGTDGEDATDEDLIPPGTPAAPAAQEDFDLAGAFGGGGQPQPTGDPGTEAPTQPPLGDFSGVRPLNTLRDRLGSLSEAERPFYFPFEYSGLGGKEQASRNVMRMLGINPDSGNPITAILGRAIPRIYQGLLFATAAGGGDQVDLNDLVNRVSQGKLGAFDRPEEALAAMANSRNPAIREFLSGEQGPQNAQLLAQAALGSRTSPFLQKYLDQAIENRTMDYRSTAAGSNLNQGPMSFLLQQLGLPYEDQGDTGYQSSREADSGYRSTLQGASTGPLPTNVEQYRPLVEKYFGDLGSEAVENMLRIMSIESGGNRLSHNLRGENSRGPLQVNVAPGANPQYRGLNLMDPETNIRVAREIFDRQGYGAWRNAARRLGLLG